MYPLPDGGDDGAGDGDSGGEGQLPLERRNNAFANDA